ncbi:MAG: hypothetical protein JNL32_07395, partial [Candidatus Kapabacteria bacterium]|nr:hypothetical protein [Candidatus Kapabacteria bacterium]
MESSKVLPVLNVTCPQNSTTQPSSVVIAIDVSSSMLLDNPLRMTTVKNAAQIALSMIDLNQSECAITSFDNLS